MLPKFGQTLHPPFVGAEVFGRTERHGFQLRLAQARQQVQQFGELPAGLLEQLGFVGVEGDTHGAELSVSIDDTPRKCHVNKCVKRDQWQEQK